jgi:hypothetical protein
MLGCVLRAKELLLLAIASTPAPPDLTRDYGIKYAVLRRYRFLRETILLKSSFLGRSFSPLRSGIRGTYPH